MFCLSNYDRCVITRVGDWSGHARIRDAMVRMGAPEKGCNSWSQVCIKIAFRRMER